MSKFIARIKVLERHPDGSSRSYTMTRIVDEKTTVGDIYDWRKRKVHDPVNGEYAGYEVILSPDDAEEHS